MAVAGRGCGGGIGPPAAITRGLGNALVVGVVGISEGCG